MEVIQRIQGENTDKVIYLYNLSPFQESKVSIQSWSFHEENERCDIFFQIDTKGFSRSDVRYLIYNREETPDQTFDLVRRTDRRVFRLSYLSKHVLSFGIQAVSPEDFAFHCSREDLSTKVVFRENRLKYTVRVNQRSLTGVVTEGLQQQRAQHD